MANQLATIAAPHRRTPTLAQAGKQPILLDPQASSRLFLRHENQREAAALRSRKAAESPVFHASTRL
jgi:hypothetical protein